VTGRIFELIGRNFVPLFVLSLIFAGLPSLLVSLLVITPITPGAPPSPAFGFDLFLAALISMVTSVVLQGALTRASLDDLSGKKASIATALSTALSLFLPLLGLGILVGLGIMVGLILLIIPGIFLALRWAVASPALVAERAGVFIAMERSAKLTEGHRWAILGLVLIYVVFLIVLNFVTGQLMGTFDAGVSTAGLIVQMLVDAFGAMVSTVAVACIYFELRQIKEGVSVTEIAAVFE
jgi:hypothetical protein